MHGMELNEQEARSKHTAIQVTFVTQPKRDDDYSIPQRPCLIGPSLNSFPDNSLESYEGRC